MNKIYYPKLTAYAEKYISGELDLKQSINGFLFENPNFNGSKNSVSMYLEAFKHLITGKTYKRNINTSLHIYYLNYIKESYPESVFFESLTSTRGHLDYRFKKSGQRLIVLENYLKENNLDQTTIGNNNRIKFKNPKTIKLFREKSTEKTIKTNNLLPLLVFISLGLINGFQIIKPEFLALFNSVIYGLISLYIVFLSKNK